MTARGADGTTYVLTLPAGAVSAATPITVTPLSKLAGVPVDARRAPAVQFGPDGLVLGTPATLRITPAKRLRGAIGFAYTGAGDGFTLREARRDGASLLVEVRHFSGAGATTMTEAEFDRFMGSLLALPITLDVAVRFFDARQAVPASRCASAHPNCFLMSIGVQNFLAALQPADCAQGGAFIAPMLAQVSLLLELEAELQSVGAPPRPVLAICRATLTTAMLDLTRDTARTDPLGVSGPCAGVAGGDIDHDGRVRDVECVFVVAAKAEEQELSVQRAGALAAGTAGLQKVLDDGNALCARSFADGRALLNRGLNVAATLHVLDQEYVDALQACQAKVTVAPGGATVETDGTLTFSAASNDQQDTSFSWSADSGAIGAASGAFTAPDTPGRFTVTATSNNDHAGSATVTVKCPPDKVEFHGTCTVIAVHVTPGAASLHPGDPQDFDATVDGSDDTRVSWGASGGTITQAGHYTAPQEPGTYTITASSLAAPRRAATATVTVTNAGTFLLGSVIGNGPLGIHADIVRWDADGTHRTLVPGGFMTDPSLSPDGHQLLYTDQATLGITLADANGGFIRRLSNPKAQGLNAEDHGAAFSPDGQHIAWVRQSVDPDQQGVYVDGERVDALHAVGRVAWSPDGRRLVVPQLDLVDSSSLPSGTVRALNADGSGDHAIRTEASRAPIGVDWSPENRILEFSGVNGDFSAVAMDPDGSHVVTVHAPGGPMADARWAPDGRSVIVMDFDGPKVVDSDGANPRATPFNFAGAISGVTVFWAPSPAPLAAVFH